tara:strand:+ start:4192 stop:4851 length:660 start_codon:yes stop_codon:yes gene_type:complete
MKKEIIKKFDVFVWEKENKIPATLTKYSDNSIDIEFNSISIQTKYTSNWSTTLQELSKKIESKGYKLLNTDKQNKAIGGFLAVSNKEETLFEYDIFIIKNNKQIAVKIIKDIKNNTLELKSKEGNFKVNFDNNWFKTLRLLDNKLNKKDLKILCNGTSKKVLATSFCLNMGDGSSAYRIIEEKKTQLVNILEYSDWNEYATNEEQKTAFFGKETKKDKA